MVLNSVDKQIKVFYTAAKFLILQQFKFIDAVCDSYAVVFTCCLVWHVLLHDKLQMIVVSAPTPEWPALLLHLSPERHHNTSFT